MVARRKVHTLRSLPQVSENVHNMPENTWLPPGPTPADHEQHVESEANPAEDYAIQIGEEQPKEGAEYPAAVKVTDEETHKAQEEAETAKRVQRASRATGPRRLSENEKLMIGSLLTLDIVKEAPSVTDVVIPIETLGEDFRLSMFQVGGERNIFQRGLAEPVYGGEPKAIVGFKLREVTMDIYNRNLRSVGAPKVKQSTKANGEPRVAVGKRSNKYGGLRLRKMRESPRAEGTHGYWSWLIYKDGMSYNEYIDVKDFQTGKSTRTGLDFQGPGRNQWMADLERGNIALYREDEPEFLEDGVTPNPRFWAINNYYER